MNIIKKITSSFNRVKDDGEVAGNNITIEQIEAYVDYLISQHDVFIATFDSLKSAERRKITEALKNPEQVNKMGGGHYIEYRKRLSANVKRDEVQTAFSSLVDANITFSSSLTSLRGELINIVGIDKVNMYNLKVMHVALLGIFAMSTELSRYSKNMFTSLMPLLTGAEVLPYKIKQINEATEIVTKVVNNTVGKKSGVSDYKSVFAGLRKAAADIALLDENMELQVHKIMNIKLSDNTNSAMAAGADNFAILVGLYSWSNTRKAEAYKRRKLEEEWLQSHTKLLKKKLEGVDPESKEYKRLLKIITKYEDQIKKLERKREKYESKYND